VLLVKHNALRKEHSNQQNSSSNNDTSYNSYGQSYNNNNTSQEQKNNTNYRPLLDHARIVHFIRKQDHLPLLEPYLKKVQCENLKVINEALNELLIEEEDFTQLRLSIGEYDNFDQISLAMKLEKHELLEFRRISAHLFKVNKRFKESVELSKKDKMFKDLIDTCKESQSHELCESTLAYFCEINQKSSFAAMTFTCFAFLRPDVVMELSWKHKEFNDFSMPYFIQYLRNTHDDLKELKEFKNKLNKKKEEEEQDQQNHMMENQQPFMLSNTPFNQGGGQGMGGGAQGFDPNFGQMNNPNMAYNQNQNNMAYNQNNNMMQQQQQGFNQFTQPPMQQQHNNMYQM